MPENQGETLQPNLQKANINDFCVVRLTPEGREILEKHQQAQGLPAVKSRESSDGTRIQLNQLMNIFGDVMFVGSRMQPFESTELVLEPGDPSFQKSATPIKLNTNDPIFVELSTEGRKKLDEESKADGIRPTTKGHLTELQFHRVANLFGSEMVIGNPNPQVKPTFYLAKPPVTQS